MWVPHRVKTTESDCEFPCQLLQERPWALAPVIFHVFLVIDQMSHLLVENWCWLDCLQCSSALFLLDHVTGCLHNLYVQPTTSFPGFSPTRLTKRESERPWKTLVTLLQNKINSEGGVLCRTFFCLVYSQRSHSDRSRKIDLLTLLQL